MKAILMSIKPQYVAKILNGEKTIEIRKKFPKDYIGWVYIYCTKDKSKVLLRDDIGKTRHYSYGFMSVAKHVNIFDLNPNLCGKVVARFWCDRVEEIKGCQVPFTYEQWFMEYWTKTFSDMEDLLKASCLDYYTLDKYLEYSKTGYAIHINNLEIFEELKEISEFIRDTGRRMLVRNDLIPYCEPLTRAPQSWCYIEI